MLRLTRPKLILIISAGLLILALVFFIMSREEVQREITKQPKPYIAEPIPETVSINPGFPDYLGTDQHPFISARRKSEIQAELELPPPVIKQPRFNLLFPRPDPRYGPELLFLLPLDQPGYQEDETQKISLPSAEILPSLEELAQLVADVTVPAAPPPEEKPIDPFPDTIVFGDNTSVKGKVIEEDEEKVIFQKEGINYSVTYRRKDIVRIDHIFSPEESYEQKAKKIRPGDANGHYKLAQWCLEQGLERQAGQQIKQALEIDETKLDFYFFAAQLYRKKMELTKEISLYKKALSSSLINKEIIHIKLGELYDMLSLPDKALASFEAAVKTYPRYIEGWLKLGQAYCKKGDYDLAQARYKRAGKIDPDNPSFIYGLAMLAFKKGELNPAKTELLKVAPRIRSRLVGKLWLMCGVISVNQREYSDGIKYFQEAIRAEPNTAQGWVNLAFMYLITQGYEEANLLLNEAARRDPASALPYAGKGYLAWLQDNIDEAIQSFEAGLKIEPAYSLAHYGLAQLYFTQRQGDKAHPVFLKCLGFKPLAIGSLYYLGLMAFQGNDFAQAAAYFDLYLKKRAKPDIADYTMRGIVYLGLEQWETARQLLETALNINPRYSPTLNSLAYLDFIANDVKTAAAKFEEVLEQTKDDPYARECLESIKLAAIQIYWEDDFSRDDSQTIGESWSETEPYGIEIELINQQLRFGGVQRIKENGLTFLERPVDRSSFIRLEVELDIRDTDKAGCGIYLAAKGEGVRYRKQGLFFGVINNELAYQISDTSETVPVKWNILPDVNISSNEMQLSIARTTLRTEQKEFKLYLNKTVVATIPATKLRYLNVADTWSAGIFGYAPIKTAWELMVNQVRIYEKKQEKKPR